MSTVTAPDPYTTDESIYLIASMDYATLVPRENVWAYGADGSIAAATPFVLTSASNDFVGADVVPSMLVRFIEPMNVYSEMGEFYAVDMLVPGDVHSIQVRRIGAATGAGEPPGLATDMAGVTFDVPTLRPQIDMAGAWIDARLSIGYAAGRMRADLAAPTRAALGSLCAYMVLRDQYVARATTMIEVGAVASTFYAKSKAFDARAAEILSSIEVRYTGGDRYVPRRRAARLWRI